VNFNPSAVSRVCIRATNWLGDAIISLPAVRAIRATLPHAYIAVVARPSLAEIYQRERSVDAVIPYPAPVRFADRRAFAAKLRAQHFDAAILLQNAFDAALVAWLAGIPQRIGYARDGRSFLLTQAIPLPEPGDLPRHERYYYLELLRRAGILERFPVCETILLDGLSEARETGAAEIGALCGGRPAIGINPGAAYGNAKRWLPERFAEAARQIAAGLDARVLVFGASAERDLCESVACAVGPAAINLAGQTTLKQFIDLASACTLMLVNDSGAMHIAAAVGIPAVAIFGATDDTTTGPSSPLVHVVREHAECSPCLLRECPIDHRCMTRVTADRVAAEGRAAIEEAAVWIRAPKF